jgi:hypothetical protein
MNTDILQQEILLVTGTTFSQRELSSRDGANDSKELSESEKLERALWDGLLDDVLPEIVTNHKLHIWQIGDTESSLLIELSEYPSKQKQFSVNPYYFLRTMKYN